MLDLLSLTKDATVQMTYKEFFFYGNLLQVHPEAKKNGK
jgi:hypothetical protein